jgi:hypothetical protein
MVAGRLAGVSTRRSSTALCFSLLSHAVIRPLLDPPNWSCLFHDGVELYTRKQEPRGCMVVFSATNCAEANRQVGEWLAEHRRLRTASIIRRLREAVKSDELSAGMDANALGELYATALHGISVQARDGVTRKRLMMMVPLLIALMHT